MSDWCLASSRRRSRDPPGCQRIAVSAYVTTGYEMIFASRVDPLINPRRVSAFHRLEHLLAELREGSLALAAELDAGNEDEPVTGPSAR